MWQACKSQNLEATNYKKTHSLTLFTTSVKFGKCETEVLSSGLKAIY